MSPRDSFQVGVDTLEQAIQALDAANVGLELVRGGTPISFYDLRQEITAAYAALCAVDGESENMQPRDSAHGLIQTARGMCTDEAPHTEIDALLSRAVDAVKDLEAKLDGGDSTRFRIDLKPDGLGWEATVFDMEDHGPDLPYAVITSGSMSSALNQACHYVLMATTAMTARQPDE